MFRSLLCAAKTTAQSLGPLSYASFNRVVAQPIISNRLLMSAPRNYYNSNNFTLGSVCSQLQLNSLSYPGFLQAKTSLIEAKRTVTKFSKQKGKRKSVKIVLMKFYRLNWGCWIRTKAGRHKKLYKKSANNRRRLQYHVFCNGRQSYLLDRMVARYWRQPKYYVDDPYEPYHSREEYPYSRLKPYQPFA